MKMVQVSFDLKEENKCSLVGSQEITYHIIFYANMEFTTKSRFVTVGHQMNPPVSARYA